MSWRIDPGVEEILGKGRDGAGISGEEALVLLHLDADSREGYALLESANHLSRTAFGDKGELHFHIGLNVEPCPMDCSFCSLTRQAGIFTDKVEFSLAAILAWARQGEAEGADALNLMTTGTFPFARLLEIGRRLKQEVTVPLVANARDINHAEGEQLLDAGFVGFYHAVRLGEGRDTPFNPQRRIETIRVLHDVGLQWMNCVEPVGPEHSPAEIVDLMLLARREKATYSGIMRRINFPGSPKEPLGMISERRMAQMVAVSRLVMGDTVRAHCTHEPHSLSLTAGANLFFPEVGSSPRDGKADTGQGRGWSLRRCAAMLWEMEWRPELPSNCFQAAAPAGAAAPAVAAR
ncbi:radical SAM protein [Desulfoprunum benzoelyticum]|uniref:Biotin synthase n=1 Tax=Desulfoprunum benzoelyticum TaxID=1506996 RepID=A0A840UTE5_9BACT|nr:radical SAM protein [Desulfoprunum benzoelyticum]MBB5348023.1 biotin synthase [Desulfoprunum benzoelyticum]MBM9531437.1 radical SAM protein [Desulfoprunum benzoelyticum]